MSNSNCLSGMRCPECGSIEPFTIAIVKHLPVYDAGVDPYGEESDNHWDNSSYCRCNECDFDGIVADFREDFTPDDIDSHGLSSPLEFLDMVARMTADCEEQADGTFFSMSPEDAVATLNGLIRRARDIQESLKHGSQ